MYTHIQAIHKCAEGDECFTCKAVFKPNQALHLGCRGADCKECFMDLRALKQLTGAGRECQYDPVAPQLAVIDDFTVHSRT